MARAAGQQKLCCLRIPHPPQQNRHAEILPAQVHSLSCVRIPQPPHRQCHPKFFPALENSARPLRGSERWQKSMGIFQEGLRRRVAECISVPLNCPHATKHPHALPHKSNACYRGSQGDPHRQRQRRVERPDQSSFAHTIQCLCQNRVAVPAVRAYVIAGVFTDPNPRWRRLADPGSC